MKQLIIHGSDIHDIDSFYKEINRVFMASEKWEIGNSLDAFDDLLYGGFGAINGKEKIKLVWLDLEKTQDALGYKVTRAYYLDKLKPGSPFNQNHFTEKLKALETGTGETYFDLIMEIISSHDNITVVSELNNQ